MGDWRDRLTRASARLLMAAAALGLTSLVIEYGFGVGPKWESALHAIQVAVVAALILDRLLRLVSARRRLEYLSEHWLDFALIGLFAAALLFIPRQFAALYVVLIQGYVAIALLLQATRLNARIAALAVRPAYVVLASFALLIATGTGVLLLPRASARPENPVGLLDAFFTATSAACVTGLTVRDTAGDFAPLGRWAILVLIQIGGLGIVTYATFFSLLQQRTLHLRHQLMMRDLLSTEVIGEVGSLLRGIVLVTLLVEAAGAVILWSTAPGDSARLEWSIFHSVSAFCNAGFALWPSAAPFKGLLLSTVLVLTVVGGLGFPVILDLWGLAGARRKRPGELLSGSLPSRPRLTVHTRLVLIVSGVLLAAGTLAFLILEQGNLLAGHGPADQAILSLFQSGVARTSGFSAVDIEQARPGTQVVVTGLMVVGASPASTGGGIKTVTLAILLATLRAMLRNRPDVELYRRTIPRLYVNAAVSITLLYGIAAFFISLALSVLHPDIGYRRLLFETVSALSTVGLSTGATTELGAGGRLLLCLAMYVGRVGPLVILMSIAGRAPAGTWRYPSEAVIVS